MIEVARLFRLEDTGHPLKAFADVRIDNVLVKGVRVVEGRNGMYAAMPTQKSKDGKWHNIVDVFDPELREELQQAVLAAYDA